jgi:phage replication-related protein YjqB (UPF0714/DUF867 family)
MADKYPCMTALYADPLNVEGTTYGKRWKRHEWIQLVEGQATDNPETQKVVLAIHGGGIEGGTSEIALAVAGFHPATFSQATDGLGFHDLWIFEGLLNRCNSTLHVTSTNYDDSIALELVQNARRCISLHGCSDDDANGKIQIGGRDTELKSIVLEELTAAGIPAQIATDSQLDGCEPTNICNKTKSGAGVQLEMGFSFRESLFAPNCNTIELRKNNTNAKFEILSFALRTALSRVPSLTGAACASSG